MRLGARLKHFLFILALMVGLALIGPHVAAYEELSPPGNPSGEYDGLYYDEDFWSKVPLPPGILLCQSVQDTLTGRSSIRCLQLPPGCILLMPTPSPSDSL